MSNEINLDSNTLVNYFHTNLDNLSNIKEDYKIYIDKNNSVGKHLPPDPERPPALQNWLR